MRADAGAADAVQEMRLAELTEQIATAGYRVDPAAVAEAILRRPEAVSLLLGARSPAAPVARPPR